MRAFEFIAEKKDRRPEISLRHLHYLKRERDRVAGSHERRLPILRAMYAHSGWEVERLELEKARLDVAQQKAELAATEAEAQADARDAISNMAKAGSKASQRSRDKVAAMAQTQMRRRKK